MDGQKEEEKCVMANNRVSGHSCSTKVILPVAEKEEDRAKEPGRCKRAGRKGTALRFQTGGRCQISCLSSMHKEP